VSAGDDASQLIDSATGGVDAGLLRLVVASIKDYAIFVLSPSGHVLTWNLGAQTLKGYAATEIIGQHFSVFYTPDARLAGRPAYLLEIAGREGRVEDEGWRVRKDGTYFWADVVITALRDETEVLVGFAKVTRDLTGRLHAEQEQARRYAAEQSADRLHRLQQATAALAGASQPVEVAAIIADRGARLLDAAGASVALVEPDGTTLELIVSRTGAARTPHADDARVFQLSPSTSPTAQARWVQAIGLDRLVVGLLCVELDPPRALEVEEHGLLVAFAEAAAHALDRTRVYQAEAQARADAEAAMHVQDEFLSVAAHELRTPVAAVKATAQLAERMVRRGVAEPDDLIRFLRSISGSADRLTALVEDLLDVARLRTGHLPLRFEQFDVVGLARDTVARLQPTFAAHPIAVRVDGEPPAVRGDPLRLEQVLDNLISNAAKYSPPGATIAIDVGPAEAGTLLRVQDSGIGLPPGEEERIFEPFGRASNVSTQHVQGLGLGLAICRQLVVAQAGRIWAASPGLDLGTTVNVWLPAAG
jgi:PAS domain S-box-containing protein